MVAFNDLNIEFNIRMEWNWLATNWCLGESTAISIVGWAIKVSLSTLAKLSDGEVPAVECLSSTEGEYRRLASWLLMRVSKDSAILEISNPMKGNPVA